MFRVSKYVVGIWCAVIVAVPAVLLNPLAITLCPVIHVVAVALLYAASSLWAFSLESRGAPILIVRQFLLNLHGVNKLATLAFCDRAHTCNPVSQAGRMSYFRLACRQGTAPMKRIRRKPDIVSNRIDKESHCFARSSPASDSADILWFAGSAIRIVPDPLTVQGACNAIGVPTDYRVAMLFEGVRNGTPSRAVRPYTYHRLAKT